MNISGDGMNRPNRRSIRLQGYDYSQAGMYFVTVCTLGKECLFGEIVDGCMNLNDAGQMVERWFGELPNKFEDIECDAFVCMPNHIHFIILTMDVGVGIKNRTSLGTIVQWFKTMTTNGYIHGVKELGWSRFSGKLWQRNYYEHVVRDENDLHYIREYIGNNPLRWELDRENPNYIAT